MTTSSQADAPAPAQAAVAEFPSDAEKLALGQSGPLLRFASENVKGLDKGLALAISQARQAQIDKTWTPATSQDFWAAFNALCDVIKPVTVDGLSAEHRDIPVKFWLRFWRDPIKESLGERSSRRYTAGLLTLLGIIVGLQLITWIYANLSDSLDTKAKALQVSSADLRAKCDALSPKTGDDDGKAHQWSKDELAAYDSITHAEAEVNNGSVRLDESSRFLAAILPGLAASEDKSPAASPGDWVAKCDGSVKGATSTTSLVAVVSDRARLLSGILLQFLLPVLFGTIGALAYVLRSTSEQIRSTTFSTTSPVRNLVRIVLGALMGVVIGLFTDLSTKINLQPLAMAFLAGYGVEPVFSMFDSLIARLK